MTKKQLKDILNDNAMVFFDRWRGIQDSGDLQTVALFVRQVLESLPEQIDSETYPNYEWLDPARPSNI